MSTTRAAELDILNGNDNWNGNENDKEMIGNVDLNRYGTKYPSFATMYRVQPD